MLQKLVHNKILFNGIPRMAPIVCNGILNKVNHDCVKGGVDDKIIFFLLLAVKGEVSPNNNVDWVSRQQF